MNINSMSPFEISEMLNQLRRAEARRILIRHERQLNECQTPAVRVVLEAQHAALVADYRRLPSVTSPGTPDPQE
jgi:hypothetical protein